MFLSAVWLSFWRHPFAAEDPLLSKWCNAKFLQICSDEETSSSTSWMAGRWIYFQQILIFGWTFPLTEPRLQSFGMHTCIKRASDLLYVALDKSISQMHKHKRPILPQTYTQTHSGWPGQTVSGCEKVISVPSARDSPVGPDLLWVSHRPPVEFTHQSYLY